MAILSHLTASLCECGCLEYRLNIGSPGFTKEQAKSICDAVNNTSGNGIDPNAVPGLLYIISELVKKSFRRENAGKYGDYSVSWSLIEKAKEAIKAAELK